MCNLKCKDACSVVMSHRTEVGMQAVKKKGRGRDRERGGGREGVRCKMDSEKKERS